MIGLLDRIQDAPADLLIGCVDSRAARSVIARSLAKSNNRTAYWSISATMQLVANMFSVSR